VELQDRIAMILYDIPDIRILSSKNEKFTSLFAKDSSGNISEHCSAGVCPTYQREVVFVVPQNIKTLAFQYQFYELVRVSAEDVVQKVELIDQFQHPRSKIPIQRYRITYKSWEKTLSEIEVNDHHSAIEELAVSKFNVRLE
jgi:phenylalanyl-tRNA synthetase alpha chain